MEINTSLIAEIKTILAAFRKKAIKSVDNERVSMYWQIGKKIFEEEQQGKEREGYGEYLIKQLSEELQPEFGTGMSIRNLKLCRQFYLAFPIRQTLSAQLGWSRYTLLIRIDNQDKRDFYIAEATKNNWSVR